MLERRGCRDKTLTTRTRAKRVPSKHERGRPLRVRALTVVGSDGNAIQSLQVSSLGPLGRADIDDKRM